MPVEKPHFEGALAPVGDGKRDLGSSAETTPEAEASSQAAPPVVRPAYPPAAASPTQIGDHGIRYDFNMGARVLVPSGNWRLRLRDLDKGNILFETTKGDVFVSSTKRYYVRFSVEAWKDGISVFEHEYSAAGREVLIQF